MGGRKKYHLLGLNAISGSVMQIEFKDPKNFSRSGLAETVLYPADNPAEIKSILRNNKGARGFMNRLCSDLKVGAAELDKEIDDIYITAEKRIASHVRRIKKAEGRK